MFDYTLLHWSTFFITAVLLNLSPGPDLAFVLGQSIKGGKRAGFHAMLGLWIGAFFHVLMAAFGLTIIMAKSAIAFTAVKWLGAGYLVWLGLKSLKSKGNGFISKVPQNKSKPVNPGFNKIFREGIIIATFNPKTAIFFLAFLPQFIIPGMGSVLQQTILHGSLIIVVAVFIEPPLIILSSRFSQGVRENKKFGLWIDRGIGALLIGLGARLAFMSR